MEMSFVSFRTVDCPLVNQQPVGLSIKEEVIKMLDGGLAFLHMYVRETMRTLTSHEEGRRFRAIQSLQGSE